MKNKENTKRNAGSVGDPEISKRNQSPHSKGVIPEVGKGDHSKTTGKPKTPKFRSSSITRGW